MEILNTKQIKNTSRELIKENKSLIGVFLGYTLLIGLISGLLNIIPIIGAFASSFTTIFMLGKMMIKMELNAFGERYDTLKMSAFVPVFLKLLLSILVYIVIVVVCVVASVVNMDNLMTATTRLTVLYSIILWIFYGYFTTTIFPEVYIASKFNDYEKEERKEIKQIFKENGLISRALKLEFSFMLQIVLTFIIFAVGVICLLGSTMSIILAVVGYIAFIIYMFALSLKIMVSRIVLYRDLADNIEWEE